MIRAIAGRHNESVKLAAKLQLKKHRRERGLFVAEGLDLLEAALAAGEFPVEVLVREDLLERLPAELRAGADDDQVDIGVCPEETLQYASSLGGAADVVSVFESDEWSLADLSLGDSLNVYLFGVGDPGNVGTLVRSAVAFGVTGLLCGPGTADPFGPKALRAGMGAQFNARIVVEVSEGDLVAKLAADQARGGPVLPVFLADAHGDLSASEIAARLKTGAGQGAPARKGQPRSALLVLGSERGRLPDVGVSQRVVIPQVALDSLNVAMAGTILLYELTRRRLGAAGDRP
jgi:RNA methyltransferase, TrmH family